MKLYGAIDLHSNNSFTVVLDEKDRVIYQKRLPNDLHTQLVRQRTTQILSIQNLFSL
jgi:hypothetical protein